MVQDSPGFHELVILIPRSRRTDLLGNSEMQGLLEHFSLHCSAGASAQRQGHGQANFRVNFGVIKRLLMKTGSREFDH